MPDFQNMYYHLFNSQTDAIRILQDAQRNAEAMYMEAKEPELIVLKPGDERKEGAAED